MLPFGAHLVLVLRYLLSDDMKDAFREELLNVGNRTIHVKRKSSVWLPLKTRHMNNESMEPVFLEMHATTILCLPSGEYMCPDATICAALMSALYSTVSEYIVLKRQLMVNVSISSTNNYCIEVVLWCLAVEGDGLGTDDLNDGGLLGTVMAASCKGLLTI